MERSSRKGGSRLCQANPSAGPSKKEIDERRLRKLKVYLRSVSFNSCEGLQMFSTLPDLYEGTILPTEFPCDTMKLSGRHHCAPTPFLIACCFNRRYPLNNTRKRAGNMRSRSLVKQGSETTVSYVQEKKTLPASRSLEKAVIVGTNKMTSNEKGDLSMTVAAGKHDVDSTLPSSLGEEVEMIPQVKCAANEEIVKQTCVKKCEGNSIEKTAAKNKGLESHEQISNSANEEHQGDDKSCTINNIIVNEKDGSNAANVNGFEQLKTDKTAMKSAEKLCTDSVDRRVRAAEKTEDLLENKNSGGKEKDNDDGLDNFSTTEKSSQLHKDEGVTCAVTSSAKIKPNELIFMAENIEDKGEKPSEAFLSESFNQVQLNMENAKSNKESFPDLSQRVTDQDHMMSNVDDSRRSSPRLSTLCSMHRNQVLDKTKSSVQRREPKIAVKMKQKVNESANTRLRSRAMIKQPGHENRYSKGQQTKGK